MEFSELYQKKQIACQLNEELDQVHSWVYVVQFVIFAVITAIFVVMIIFHMKYRQKFPIIERSPILTLLLAISTYTGLAMLVIGAFINVQQFIPNTNEPQSEQKYNGLGLQSPLFCICNGEYTTDGQPPCQYWRDQQVNDPFKFCDNDQLLTINFWMMLIFLFSKYVQIISYILRNQRLIVAFSNSDWKIIEKIFSNENILMGTSIAFSILLTILSALSYKTPFTYYIWLKVPGNSSNVEENTNQIDYYKQHYYGGSSTFYLVYYIIIQVALILQWFFSRQILREYKLQREILILIITMIVVSNFFLIGLEFQHKDSENVQLQRYFGCTNLGGVFYTEVLLQILFDLIFIGIIVVFPMFLRGGPMLPPQITLQDFKNFMTVTEYFYIFYRYLQKATSESNEDGVVHALVLSCYMEIKTTSQEDWDEETIAELIDKYMIQEESVKRLIPPEQIGEFIKEGEQGNNVPQDNLHQDLVQTIFQSCEGSLQYQFVQYRKTQSYKYLQVKTSQHSRINDRLSRMNLCLMY